MAGRSTLGAISGESFQRGGALVSRERFNAEARIRRVGKGQDRAKRPRQENGAVQETTKPSVRDRVNDFCGYLVEPRRFCCVLLVIHGHREPIRVTRIDHRPFMSQRFGVIDAV